MQNQKTLQQMIREYEAQMPPEIMNLISSFDWKKQLRLIVNQNQLMLDIASDLEESVYLMILGVVDIEEVYQRLIETHGLPEDKVQKVLTEVEKQIFEPMHSKLAELGPVESDEDGDESVLRDDILQEIEKEPEMIIQKESPQIVVNVPNSISTSSSESNQIEQPEASREVDSGIAEGFSLTPRPVVAPQDITDPIATALVQPTVTQIPSKPSMPPPPPPKNYAADPYREPIE